MFQIINRGAMLLAFLLALLVVGCIANQPNSGNPASAPPNPNSAAPPTSSPGSTDTGTVSEPSGSEAEKEAIIAAIIERDAVFRSGDASRIRSYGMILAESEESRRQLEETSDADLLKAFEIYTVVNPPSAGDLRFSGAEWTIGESAASVKVSKVTDGVTSSQTYSVVKINGKWY